MNSSDRLKLFDLLGLLVAVLSIATMLLALNANWRYVAGIAVFSCVVYQIRIWLIRPLVRRDG